MRERILAIVGAAALIAVAFVIRSVVAGDDGAGGAGGGGGRPVVACTPDLMAVCDALVADGRIANNPPALDLGVEAAAAEVGGRRLDGWVTWDPAPGIANLDATQAGRMPRWDRSTPLGASPLAVATTSNNAISLPEGCSFDVAEWSCLNAPPPGLALGVGSGETSESLARLHPIAASLVPPEGDFTDLEASKLGAILDSPPDGQDPFPHQLTTLRTKPGALSLLVGPQRSLERAGNLLVAVPEPASGVVVVLAQRDRDADLLGDGLDSAAVDRSLRDAGVTPGEGKLAPEDRAGDLSAVRQKVG